MNQNDSMYPVDEEDEKIANYLRLANLKSLHGKDTLQQRIVEPLVKMNNYDLQGTSAPMLPPEPAPIDANVGDFDVRANRKIELSNSANQYSQIAQLNNVAGNEQPPVDPQTQQLVDSESLPVEKNIFQTLNEGSGNQEGIFKYLANVDNDARRRYEQSQSGMPAQQEAIPAEEPSGNNIFQTLDEGSGNQEGIFKYLANVDNDARERGEAYENQRFEDESEESKVRRYLASLSDDEIIERQNKNEADQLAQDQAAEEALQLQNTPEMQEIQPAEPEAQNAGEAPEAGEAQQGAVEEAVQTRENLDEFKRLTGVDVNPEMAKLASEYETAIVNLRASNAEIKAMYGENIAKIQERIKSRELSTKDKILMAIALLAPALISGAIGGKEAFLGGLSGGFKGLSDSLIGREKSIKDDEESLRKLAIDKMALAKGSVDAESKYAKEMADAIPNKDLRELAKKDSFVKDGKLYFNTGDPMLPLNSERIRDISDYKRFKEKDMPELQTQVSGVRKSIYLLDSLDKIVEASEAASKTGFLGTVAKAIPILDPVTKVVKSIYPFSRDSYKDENGNEIKYSALYDTTREALMDAQRQLLGGGKASEHFAEHFYREVPTMHDFDSFIKGTSGAGQIQTQLRILQRLSENNMTQILESKGVDTEPVKELFSQSGMTKSDADKKRKKNRVNEAVKSSIGAK